MVKCFKYPSIYKKYTQNKKKPEITVITIVYLHLHLYEQELSAF